MTDAPDARTKRPSGGVIAGWVAILFCGFLALLNAVIATDLGFRILFIVCGTILVVGGLIIIWRWYRKTRPASRHSSD